MTEHIASTTDPKRIRSGHVRAGVNLAFFICMVIVLAPNATGIAVHEWASFVIIIPFFAHMIMDWKWIVRTTKRLFARMSGERRFNYFLDWLLFFLFVVAMFTGVLISESALPAIGINIVIDPFWSKLHDTSSNIMSAVLGVHLAMHWKWIATNVNKYILRRSGNSQTAQGAS
ncbi:MAG: DUF4405 domain-containing protein [Mariniblastus sp.]